MADGWFDEALIFLRINDANAHWWVWDLRSSIDWKTFARSLASWHRNVKIKNILVNYSKVKASIFCVIRSKHSRHFYLYIIYLWIVWYWLQYKKISQAMVYTVTFKLYPIWIILNYFYRSSLLLFINLNNWSNDLTRELNN